MVRLYLIFIDNIIIISSVITIFIIIFVVGIIDRPRI